MENLSNIYGSFAPANFDDDNNENTTLSCEFSNSKEFVSMTSIIENLKNTTLNAIENEFVYKHTPDTNYKNNIKSKYANIKNKLIMLGVAGHLQQLEAFIKPVEDNPFLTKIINIAQSLNSDHFNGFSNDLMNNLNIDISGCSFFYEKFGTNLDNFRNTLKNICDSYDEAYIELIDTDEDLHKSINKFTKLTKQIDDILSLDLNDVSHDVYNAFTKYMSLFFKEQNIKEKFDKFILARKKYVAYRELMCMCRKTLNNTDENTESPICSICLTSPVKTAFVPCGHTFCLQCAPKNIIECYLCRTRINSRLKLYFS
jgi:hypothetical protein